MPFWDFFWKVLIKKNKNRVFFGARYPLKLVNIGAQGASRKFSVLVDERRVSEEKSVESMSVEIFSRFNGNRTVSFLLNVTKFVIHRLMTSS